MLRKKNQLGTDLSLKERIETAESKLEKNQPDTPTNKLHGGRVVTELASHCFTGGMIGWLLDIVFGTKPIIFIIGFFFGVAASIRTIYNLAQKQLNDEFE